MLNFFVKLLPSHHLAILASYKVPVYVRKLHNFLNVSWIIWQNCPSSCQSYLKKKTTGNFNFSADPLKMRTQLAVAAAAKCYWLCVFKATWPILNCWKLKTSKLQLMGVTLTSTYNNMKIKGSLEDPYFQNLDFEWKSEAETRQSSGPVFCQSGYFIKSKVHILLLIAEPVPFCKKPNAS